MNMSSCCWYACFVMLSFLNISISCCLPCHAIKCFVVSGMSLQSCYHESVYAMSCFSSKSETVHKTCHVGMGATLFSMPLWVMISKGDLFYVFSTSMSFLCLPWYVLVACCVLALTIASWCWFWHVNNFSKSMKLISFALLPCLFEPILVWFSHSSVFMFCQASLVHHFHMLCYYVGVH